MLHQTNLPVTLKKTTAKITPRAGLILIEKVAGELQMEQLLDLHFGSLKQRKRGLLVSRQIMDIACMLIDGGERIEDINHYFIFFVAAFHKQFVMGIIISREPL